MNTTMDILEIIKIVGPAVAVYVGIRVDMAELKIRVQHLERDLYKPEA